MHTRETDPTNSGRRFYFGKIQIWNGHSRAAGERRQPSPFLVAVCACAGTASSVLCRLPFCRVVRPRVEGPRDRLEDTYRSSVSEDTHVTVDRVRDVRGTPSGLRRKLSASSVLPYFP